MSRLSFLLLALAFATPLPAQTNETTFTSKSTRTHLLELYTSEGCSSCPPAEAWFSQLKDAPGLWQNFVPLAYHVDYWDRLGWRDPFASKAWTARQYAYSALWKSGSVYTPGFVLDGKEERDREIPSASNEKAGILKVSLRGSDRAQVSYEPANAAGRSFTVHVAKLGFGLKIKVKAGENKGRDLSHDFVVLGQTDVPLTSASAEVRIPANDAPTASPTRTALAVWVTEVGRLEPLQATGGWLR
ncbi:MAG: DUF1223 domain-containing protein [Chthoniobacterales bacterium]